MLDDAATNEPRPAEQASAASSSSLCDAASSASFFDADSASLPTAIAAPRDGNARLHRFAAELFTRPPRFARNRLTWALSAALVASVIHLVTAFGLRVCGCELDGEPSHRAELADTVLLAIASLFFSLALFPPLRLAAGLYFLLVRRADARWTAAWIAGTQAAAHVTALAFLGLPLTLHLWVPIAVGGLWGAWLPRVKPPEIS